MRFLLLMTVAITLFCHCDKKFPPGSFGYDLNFLCRHTSPLVLRSPDNQRLVIISPEHQGRVMTSTSSGLKGKSYGWINHDLIASGKLLPQFNPIGGEDRLWMGPEGSQFGLFFEPGASFTWDHWRPPSPFDKDTFKVTYLDTESAILRHSITLHNYFGTTFKLDIEREIQLLGKTEIEKNLGVMIPEDLSYVAFSSINKVTNKGKTSWNMKGGLVSIWILGVFIPSPSANLIIPVRFTRNANIYDLVNTEYYWDVPSSRLVLLDSVLFFKADGNFQCKIGIRPANAKCIVGSYDTQGKQLTLVQFTLNTNKPYVNSSPGILSDPFNGDVLNFYNDGIPIGKDTQYGPFYEIESSSPGLELSPEESAIHIHTTYHFEGDEKLILSIAEKIFGVEQCIIKCPIYK